MTELNKIDLIIKKSKNIPGWPTLHDSKDPIDCKNYVEKTDFIEVGESMRTGVFTKPISLNLIKKWWDNIELFNEFYGDKLTYPPTWQGWASSIAKLSVDKNNIDKLKDVWDCVFSFHPYACTKAISWVESKMHDSGINNAQTLKVNNEQLSETEQKTEIKSSSNSKWVQELLKERNSGHGWEARWDHVFQEIKLNNRNLEAWWHVSFPAILSLNTEQIIDFANHWPSPHKIILTNPVNWLKSPSFWNTLNEAHKDKKEKDTAIYYFLEKVVSHEYWSNELKEDILLVLLNYTEKNENLFKSRLELWKSWGGDLDASWKSSDIWSGSMTVKEVLLSKDNKVWNNVLEKKVLKP
jgi:hypothetical protein